MKTLLFLISLTAFCAAPAWAQLGPAGVPGAPGLAPEPSASAEAKRPPAPASVPKANQKQTRPAVPAACAKARNVKQCVARQEVRRQARTVCKGKKNAAYKRCFDGYLRRHPVH